MKYKFTCNSCGESVTLDTKKPYDPKFGTPIKICPCCGFKYIKEELLNKDEVIKKLEEKKSKLEDKCYETQLDEHKKFNSLGWGCAMRGYKKLSSLNLTRSDKLEEKIKDIEKQLEILMNHEDGLVQQV
jgi:SMC interacting uncharacterized protein involved in chromosome segregation